MGAITSTAKFGFGASMLAVAAGLKPKDGVVSNILNFGPLKWGLRQFGLDVDVLKKEGWLDMLNGYERPAAMFLGSGILLSYIMDGQTAWTTAALLTAGFLAYQYFSKNLKNEFSTAAAPAGTPAADLDASPANYDLPAPNFAVERAKEIQKAPAGTVIGADKDGAFDPATGKAIKPDGHEPDEPAATNE